MSRLARTALTGTALLVVPSGFYYPDEVVRPTQVQLGEDLGPSKIRKGCRNQGKRVSVLDGVLVEYSIINT